MASHFSILCLGLLFGAVACSTAVRLPDFLKLPSQVKPEEVQEEGTHWALLIAGSSGYGNYRHQVWHGHLFGLNILFEDVWRIGARLEAWAKACWRDGNFLKEDLLSDTPLLVARSLVWCVSAK